MGTGRLNIKKLRGLLERRKIALELLEGDAARDGCLIKLTSVRAPDIEGLLEYENWGEEPRRVELRLFESGTPDPNRDPRREPNTSLELRGSRDKDPEKIAEWLEREYLHRATARAATSLLD